MDTVDKPINCPQGLDTFRRNSLLFNIILGLSVWRDASIFLYRIRAGIISGQGKFEVAVKGF